MTELFPMRPSGSRMQQGLQSLIQFANKRLAPGWRMAEIGSYAGESTHMFARVAGTIFAVDPWAGGYNMRDAAAHFSDLAEQAFDRRMAQCPNVRKLKQTSKEAVDTFEDTSLDLVYIDAEHSYQAVKEDIELWLPKLRTNGMIAGHDYRGRWGKEIRKAVHETIGKPDMVFIDSSWLICMREAPPPTVMEKCQNQLHGLTWRYQKWSRILAQNAQRVLGIS